MNWKNFRKLSINSIILVLLLICAGCQEKDPDILSQGEMEDLLYDYHMADAIVKTQGLDSIKAQPYIEDVFEKHGINQKIFDKNMEYYLRRANLLADIYTNISDRLDNQARKMGIDDVGSYMAMDNSTDTLNVWKKERFYVLRDQAPYNLVSYTINCDSAYHPGDHLFFSLRSDFLYQDGSRNGYAIMSVKFKNDSVTNRNINMVSSSQYRVDVTDESKVGFKQIKCYIMHRQSNNPAERISTTMRLMAISDIKLILIHPNKDDNGNDDDNEKENDNDNKNESKDEKINSKPLPPPLPPADRQLHPEQPSMH